MVVSIHPHFFQVIVLPAHPQTFLGIGHPTMGRLTVPQKIVLELVHPRIREQQCRVVFYDDRSGRNDMMTLGSEKVQEFLSDVSRSHGSVCC